METINNICGSRHCYRNTILYEVLSGISIPTTAATGMDALQVWQ